jgi:hypothetical protein
MAERYHEVVIEGARGRAYGFVEGFLVARGMVGRMYEMESEGFDCSPLRERVRELFHPSDQTYHTLVPGNELPVIRLAAAEAQARGLKVAIHDERPVEGVRFRFSFRIYSRPYAARIRGWFENPPEGATLSEDASFDETTNPEGAGVEAYAPAHEYELAGQGAVSGNVDGVIELYRRCRTEELVHLHPLELLIEG